MKHRIGLGAKMENPAELFEAISHPTRIKILKFLENEPSSFASLKRQLGISSSGNLDHHLKKLGQLIDLQKDGHYGLTDTGKEALASVGAVESWTETERRKLKKFTKLPQELIYLVALVSTVAVASFLVSGVIKFPDSTWPFFSEILGMVFLLGSLSAVGILKGKSWGWRLTVVQAVMFFAFTIFPIFYTANILSNLQDVNPVEQSFLQGLHDLPVYQPIPELIQRWAGYVVVGTVEALVLFVALRRNVRKFFGVENVTSHQRRVLVAGMLVLLFGMLVFGASSYSPWSFRVAAQLEVLIVAFVVFLGGIAILMQKYLLGGLMTLAFIFFPVAYLSSTWPLNFTVYTITGFPFTPIIQLTATILILVIPFVALLLIRSNLKPAFSDFFGNIWRNLMG